MNPAIAIKNLSFSYGRHAVLQDISLEIPEKQFTILLGKNGSGKSTLLRLIAGLLDPSAGRVSVLGKDLGGLRIAERARLLGFLAQHHTSVFPFTVEDVVLTGRAAHVAFIPKAADRDKAEQAIDTIGIGHLRGRAFTELSGGEQQLVMIARVLAQAPRVILLDEPTSSLDIFNQARFLGMVREFLGMGLTVLAVLHDPNMAFLYGDNFVFLKDRRLFTPDPGQSPWDAAVLEQVYNARLEAIPHHGRALIVPQRETPLQGGDPQA
jgi:iron complex transport system ATP-binding protein